MSRGDVSEQKNLDFEMFLRSVPERWKALKPTDSPSTAAALLCFGSQLELFSAFNTAPGRLVARSLLLRAMLEVLADLGHIMRDSAKIDQRSKDYINAANELREKLLEAVTDIKTGGSTGTMRKLTDWTTSTIEDRLNAITPNMTHLYDVLSYCTHSHPGKVWLFGDDPEEGPITEGYLRRLALTQMVSVATRAGDLGVLNDPEKAKSEAVRVWIEQTI